MVCVTRPEELSVCSLAAAALLGARSSAGHTQSGGPVWGGACLESLRLSGNWFVGSLSATSMGSKSHPVIAPIDIQYESWDEPGLKHL